MTRFAIDVQKVCKSFTLHLRGGVRIDAVRDVSFAVAPGECVVLGGPSGAGKSSVLKMIYGNYRVDAGAIRVAHGGGVVDVARADPRTVLGLRKGTLGYVSQFLRVIPRVSTLDVVAEAAGEGAQDPKASRDEAARLLALLNIPERLWGLPPATFSGGEQQRVNIARGLAAARPILLLDEPTASLDAANRAVVVGLIAEKKRAGVALVGVFHDEDVRDRVADRIVDVAPVAARHLAEEAA